MVVLFAGCSGKTATTQSSSVDSGGGANGGDGGGDGGSTRAPPTNHRATGVACSTSPTGPEPVIPDAGSDAGAFTCSMNEQCTAKPGGRCYYSDGTCGEPCMQMPPSSTCLYDECKVDTDCKSPGVCVCGTGGGATNYCTVVGDCRVDADCPSGYCSPSVDGCGAFNGYFCHTAADQCFSDEDCANAGAGINAKCVAGQPGPWTCGPVGCASAGGAM